MSTHRRARGRRSLARTWLRAAKSGWLTHSRKRRTSLALRLLRRHHRSEAPFVAPKPSTRPRLAAQPNAAEKKVPCGTCNHDSWIFAHRWIPGRTIRFCCHPFPKPVLEHSLLAKRAAVDSGTVSAGRIEPWLREVLKESRMPLNALATDGASKKIRALRPDLVSTSEGEGGVDLWISLTKEMQKLQQQQMQLVDAAVRHKRKAEQEERAVEVGKSISQLQGSQYVLLVFTYRLPVRSFN